MMTGVLHCCGGALCTTGSNGIVTDDVRVGVGGGVRVVVVEVEDDIDNDSRSV